MAMFPVFILGLIAGVILTSVCFHYIKSVPSNIKFKLQEDTIENMQEDMRTMELVNEDLRNQIEKLKAKERKTKTTKTTTKTTNATTKTTKKKE